MEQDGGEADNSVAGPITLAQPRPGAARRQNEYIEALQGRFLRDDGCRPPVTAQPTGLKKDVAATDHNDDSIICRQCRRCKCEACTNPRHLPSKWICNNKCLCSAPNLVDYCSCMCCVRGLFYHWAKDYEMDTDVSCADQPCSCSPHQRLLRWGCLGLLALPLPCLCCYWPMRGCLRASEACYSSCSGHGCRCAPQHRTARLLDSDC